MASNTANLELYKKDPSTDGNDTFNIETMLNENWDKLDNALGDTSNLDSELQQDLTDDGKSVDLSNSVNKLYENQKKPKYSAEQEVTTSIFSTDENSVDGQFSGELKGNSISQEVENGDVETSLTSDNTGTQILLNNDGTWSFENVSLVSNQVLNIINGHTYFAYCKIKSTSVGRISNVGYCKDVNSKVVFGDSVDSLEIGYKRTASETVKANFLVREGASGLIERDYQLFIDMTANGIEDYTEEQMLELCRMGYWEGTKSTNSVRIKSVGKNLFDKIKLTSGSFVRYDNGQLQSVAGTNYSDYIRVRPETYYVVSGITEGYAGQNMGWAVCDKNRNYIIGWNNTNARQMPVNAYYVRVSASDSDMDRFMFEEGTTATTYVEHEKSEVYVDVPFNDGELTSVPNGSADSVNLNSGTATQRNKKYVLQSGDVTNITNRTNYQRVTITLNNNSVGTASVLNDKVNFPDKTEQTFDDIETGVYNNTGYYYSDTINLAFDLSTYASLAEAQADLAGTELIYQLAQEIPHELNITPLTCWGANTTVYVEPYMSRGFTYSSGITFDVPVSEIDSVEKVDTGETIVLDNVTLATDGLSITITGATDGEGYIVKAPIRTEESTIPTIAYSYPLNTAGALDSVIKATNTQSAILNDHEMMLLTLSLQILDLQNA